MPAILGLALPAVLAAQASLDGALKAVRGTGVPWVLVLGPEGSDAFTALGDDTVLRLRLEGHLVRVGLNAQQARELGEARGWGAGAHWLLCSAQGETVGDGAGLPSGEELLTLLRSKGLKPRWELRRAFLHEHPDHGEALEEEVTRAARLASLRLSALAAAGKAKVVKVKFGGLEWQSRVPEETDPVRLEQAGDKIYGELASALAGLREVEGWWEDDPLMRTFGLQPAISPRIREVCGTMAADLELALGRLGAEFELQGGLVACRNLAGKPLLALPDVEPGPGFFGVPLTLVLDCLANLGDQGNWEGALRLLDNLPTRDAQKPWTPDSWRGWTMAQGCIAGMRVLPLFELGRLEDACSSLAIVRASAGPGWPRAGKDAFFIGAKVFQEKFFQDALKEPALPAPPMPQIPALRMVLVGEPPWKRDWEGTRKAEALLPWSPAELQWSALSPEAAAILRAQKAWDPQPRWALLRGEDLLATGTQCPGPLPLAAVLAQEGPTQLQRLTQFLDRHPEHLGGHRTRMALLEARMPEPRLEALLAEDARATFSASAWDPRSVLSFGPDAPWKPDEALWQWSAQQVLPKLEALLRSWPSHAGHWKAWLAWAAFHPSRPSVVALTATLPLWQPQSRWIGVLPVAVHRAVARELREAKNDPALVRWLEDAWAGVDHTPASKVEDWDYVKKVREPLREGIVAPLAAGLRSVGRGGEAMALEATYREMMNR